MTREKDTSLKVKHFYHKAKDVLNLKTPHKKTGFFKKLDQQNIRADPLAVQIWSQPEIQKFIQLSPARKETFLSKKLTDNVLFVIFPEEVEIPSEILQKALDKNMALFVSPCSKDVCRKETNNILSQLFSGQVVVPGGLLQISGLGILIIGDSGVGKSESALELISRGYRFVSDDVTRIEKGPNNRLVGTAPDLTRHFMEIRGLSIINIKQIFGPKSTCRKSEIDLVIQLKKWEKGKKYDRLGLETLKNYEIMGVKVPMISIPVAPGRNIATLIEVACKVQILKKKGYHAPEEIAKKLDRALSLR